MERDNVMVLYVVEQDGRIIYTESDYHRAKEYRDMFYKEARVIKLVEVGEL